MGDSRPVARCASVRGEEQYHVVATDPARLKHNHPANRRQNNKIERGGEQMEPRAPGRRVFGPGHGVHNGAVYLKTCRNKRSPATLCESILNDSAPY